MHKHSNSIGLYFVFEKHLKIFRYKKAYQMQKVFIAVKFVSNGNQIKFLFSQTTEIIYVIKIFK